MIRTKQELKEYIIKYATTNNPISTHAIYEHLNYLHDHRLLRRDLGYTRGTVARVLRGYPGVVFRDKMWRVNDTKKGRDGGATFNRKNKKGGL